MFWIINKREMMPMIKVIAGAKGTGKTAQLVDDINEQAVQEKNNIGVLREEIALIVC
jgi:HrpA-like RNA helicase